MKFNNEKFLESVCKIHLNAEEFSIYSEIPDDKVREKINELIPYGKNMRISRALERICKNLVGKTMFKLLITKITKKGIKMQIVEHIDPDFGSIYDNYVVYVNLSRYDENKGDVGIESMQYYCINKEGKIETKHKSLAESIFHEFCHALHDVSETYIPRIKKKCRLVLGEDIWTNDEELKTICCSNHDPICDHCFDFIMSGDSFRPRCAHGGYVKGAFSEQEEVAIREKLKKRLPLSQVFMDGWKEYVI